MIIKIGTASKEINSTAVPTLTTEIDVQLKDGVSITSPVILLRDEVYNQAWNYIYIPKWGRYYFLHDAVIMNGIWSIQCAIDVLASWRSYILAGSAYVARSASNYSNLLEDSTWCHTSTPTVTHTTITMSDLDSYGCFLLFTTSNDGQATAVSVPAVSCYVMTPEMLKNTCNYMFTSDFYTKVMEGNNDDNAKVYSKLVFNPFQYVTKCLWLPFKATDIPHTAQQTVNFGWWESTVQAPLVNQHKMTTSFSFTQGSYNDWTDRNAGWVNSTLYVPGFGQLNLSPDFQGKTLTATITVDLATGDGGLFIKDSNGALVQSATGKLGADIQLSGLYEDVTSDLGSKASAVATGVKSVIGGAVNALTNKESRQTIVGAIKNYMNATAHAMVGDFESSDVHSVTLSSSGKGSVASSFLNGVGASLQPTMSTIGANGTRAIIENNISPILTITKFSRYEDIHERIGGMCCKVISPLSSLSGYTEVVNPHINCPATSEEITQINEFLSGGFYIE